MRRLSASEIRLADQIYPRVAPRALLDGGEVGDPRLQVYWNRVSPDRFSAE